MLISDRITTDGKTFDGGVTRAESVPVYTVAVSNADQSLIWNYACWSTGGVRQWPVTFSYADGPRRQEENPRGAQEKGQTEVLASKFVIADEATAETQLTYTPPAPGRYSTWN